DTRRQQDQESRQIARAKMEAREDAGNYARKEVRHESEMTTLDEVDEIHAESRPPAAAQHLLDLDAVHRHRQAARLQRRAAVVEGEPAGEALALASLIIELSGDEPVDGERDRAREREREARCERGPKASAQERPCNERNHERQVAGLRERRQAQ